MQKGFFCALRFLWLAHLSLYIPPILLCLELFCVLFVIGGATNLVRYIDYVDFYLELPLLRLLALSLDLKLQDEMRILSFPQPLLLHVLMLREQGFSRMIQKYFLDA